MRFSSILHLWKSTGGSPRHRRPSASQLRRTRLRLEPLEDRTLPSNYTAATVTDLIADINAANKAGGANTITLTAATTTPYVLTAVDNTTNGANGLPVISGGSKKLAADNLTIIGNGDTIARSTATGTPDFRLFDVAGGGSLTLQDMTLQGGLAFGSGAAADGGAIYNQGTLTLINTTVQNNEALGSNGAPGQVGHKSHVINAQPGADAEGGGIWTNGTVKVEGGIIGSTDVSNPLGHTGEGNEAIGGNGGSAGLLLAMNGGAGGGGFGGGLYQAGGSVTVTNATLVGNAAAGGVGGFDNTLSSGSFSGNGGAASGGAIDVAGGTLVMSNNGTVKTNLAIGGKGGGFSGSVLGGTGGTGAGGGIYVGSGAVNLQTVQLLSNRAQGGDGGEYRFTGGVTIGAIEYDRGLGGSGLGGGLYVGGGVVTLTGDTVTGNGAYAGGSGSLGVPNGSPGVAVGAGIDIAPQATVSLDSFTVTNTTKNDDYVESNLGWYLVGEDDIHGYYTLT